MQALFDALFGNPLISLFFIIALGLALGNVSYKGLSFGSSAVLFVALFFGALGYGVPQGIGQLGLVLFVYCVGISAGTRFFSTIAKQGTRLAKLSACIVLTGAAATILLAVILDVPPDIAVGIFAGALTSTPALATALESFRGSSALVPVGYSIAYPFGVVGVVLFVQLLPRMMGKDVDAEAKKLDSKDAAQPRISSCMVEVTNQNIFGRRIADVGLIHSNHVQISRVLSGDRLVPLKYDDTFAANQHLLLVGEEKRIELIIDFLGRKSTKSIVVDADRERRQLVVTSREFAGKTLRELSLLKRFGVVVSRISRNDITFVPDDETEIENLDQLTTVGTPEDLQRFSEAVGHRTQAVQETDILSLSTGIIVGILLGLMPITLPGTKGFTLGLAGGPLIVALVLGHFGRIGPIVGFIPRPSRLLLRELGLVLFLADAGVRGGGGVLAAIEQYGFKVLLMSLVVTVLPMLAGALLSFRVFRCNLAEALGGICGGMTSTPALGVVSSKTDSQVPVISYAAAYPVAMLLMIVCAEVIIKVLS